MLSFFKIFIFIIKRLKKKENYPGNVFQNFLEIIIKFFSKTAKKSLQNVGYG